MRTKKNRKSKRGGSTRSSENRYNCKAWLNNVIDKPNTDIDNAKEQFCIADHDYTDYPGRIRTIMGIKPYDRITGEPVDYKKSFKDFILNESSWRSNKRSHNIYRHKFI
jgi:hypothetical protein